MNNFPKGNDLIVKWAIKYSDGTPFPLENYAWELCYSAGRGINVVKDTAVISVSDNLLTWRFSGKDQAFYGKYSLTLRLYQQGKIVATVRKNNAFELSTTQYDGPCDIDLVSYCDNISLQDALLRGNRAMEVAQGAKDIAGSAVNTAAGAVTTANDAKAIASTANNTSTEAKTIASNAKTVADQAKATADATAATATQKAEEVAQKEAQLEAALNNLSTDQSGALALSTKVNEHGEKLSELEVNTILLLEVTKTVEGKIYNSEDLSTISSPNYRSAVIEVHEGESYVVTCSSNNDVWCGAFVALGNGSLQKILIRHGVYTNELINIPTGGVRLYLNGFGNLMNLDELDAKKVENKIGKTVQKLVSDVEKRENTIERLYTNMSLSFEKIKDCLFKTDKTRYGSAEFPYAKIDVSGINKIQATSDQVSITANNKAFWVVIFIGENGAILSGKNIIELGGNDVRYFNDAEIEVPVGAKYVLVNGNNVSANGLDVFLPEENKKEISNIKEHIGEGQDLLDAIYRASIAPNFKMKALDKAYFSWTNDDALQIHRSYKAICDEFGCPYCPAIIWENFGLPISATNICGEELVQFCNEVINNGGEILSHGVKVLTSASTDADFEEYFKTSQEVFKKNLGVVPRGKIMHGGPNSGTINPAKCQKYYLRYFDFADFMSIKSPMISNQYKLERFVSSIGSGTEDEQFNRYKNMIDDAIANKKWVRMWCHNENELSLNVFRRILTYISSKKQEGLADFATWSYMYDNFGDFSY